MLYVSTRNTAATYTAHRAIHETRTPDGGVYVPFLVPVFSAEQLLEMRQKNCLKYQVWTVFSLPIVGQKR